MRYETLHDGTSIPVIGLGTWNIGGGMSPDRSSDRESIESIRNAIRMGYTHIDTAQMYGAGHTEELVGRAIKTFPREELFVTTKVWSSDLRKKDVLSGFEGSLSRLVVDYVDLFLIHWPNPAIPLEETFEAFNELVRRKVVRYVGVSNFSRAQLREAERLSDAHITTNQVEYNLLNREPERNGVLEYCRKAGIILTAYEPLGKWSIFSNRALQELAASSGVSAAQLAINWLLRKPNVITIPKSVDEGHLRENLKAVDMELPREVINALDDLA
jgi:diketogulonate reductase-like aldo/keto reductase